MPDLFRRNLRCPVLESQLDGLGLQSLINPDAFDEGFRHIEPGRPLKTVRQDSRFAHSTEMKGSQFTPNQVVTAQIPLALNTQQVESSAVRLSCELLPLQNRASDKQTPALSVDER